MDFIRESNGNWISIRIFESYMLSSVPLGPLELGPMFLDQDFSLSEPIAVVPGATNAIPYANGFMSLRTDWSQLPATPTSRIRSSLFAHDLINSNMTYVSTLESSPSTERALLPIYGLPQSAYDLVVHMFYVSSNRSYDLRSPIYRLQTAMPSPMLLADREDHWVIFEHAVLSQFRNSENISLDAVTASGEEVSFSAGWRYLPDTNHHIRALPPVVSYFG